MKRIRRVGGAVIVACLSACTTAAPVTSTTGPGAPTSTVGATTSTVTTASVETTVTTTPTTTVAATTTVGPALAGRVVVIDPGHNGANARHPDEINRLVDIGVGTKACNTTGTSTDDGYPEARFTWEVAQVTRQALEDLGATVVLTRDSNDGWGPCIDRRAAIGNEAHADAVISIHADGAPAGGRGFHVIYPEVIEGLTDDIAADSQTLAVSLRDAYLRVTGMPVSTYLGAEGLDRRSDLGGLDLSDVPAVFLESGNMRNPTDAAMLTDPDFRQLIARAIAEAVVDFVAGR